MEPIATAAALGRAVRVRRRERDLTLVETAELAGVGVRFMSELENGKPTVRLDKVMQVIRVLGLQLQIDAATGKAESEAPAGDAFGLGGLMGAVRGFLEVDESGS